MRFAPLFRRALRHAPLACLLLGAGVSPAVAGTTVMAQPGQGRNRITVQGNTAQDVQLRCAQGRGAATGAHVNSVQVDRRALEGRTVVVTGHNSHDVQGTADCGADPQAPAVNVNSINIR